MSYVSPFSAVFFVTSISQFQVGDKYFFFKYYVRLYFHSYYPRKYWPGCQDYLNNTLITKKQKQTNFTWRTANAEVDRHGAAPTYRLTMSGAKLPLARPLGIGGRRFTPAAQNVSAALRSKPIKHSSATTCDRKSKTHTVGTHSPINHSISTSVVTILK